MKLRVTREEIRSSANRMMYDRYTSVTLATTALRYSWIRGCSISDGTSSNEVIILLIRSIIPRWRLVFLLKRLEKWKIKEEEGEGGGGKKRREKRKKKKRRGEENGKVDEKIYEDLFFSLSLFFPFLENIVFHVVAIDWMQQWRMTFNA